MKFLITDYSSGTQLEALQFNMGLNLLAENCSKVWTPGRGSAFDMFDLAQPDFWITHIAHISKDALTYMGGSDRCKLILNVTGSSQEDVAGIVKTILSFKVHIALLFTNDSESFKVHDHTVVSIPLGADVFVSQGKSTYSMPKAFVINNQSEIPVCDQPHHILSFNTSLVGVADIVLPAIQMGSLYQNYDEVIFRYAGKIVPQALLDAIYHGKRAYFSIDNQEASDYMNSKVSRLLKCEKPIHEYPAIEVKKAVAKKHTCLHRLKSLLSQIPSGDLLSKLDTVLANIKEPA